ncbi:hypothetical protein Droror1_Dr00009408 [Drosera rotundifolia]
MFIVFLATFFVATCRQIRSKLEKTNRRSWVARLCMQLTRSVHLRRYSVNPWPENADLCLCFLAGEADQSCRNLWVFPDEIRALCRSPNS